MKNPVSLESQVQNLAQAAQIAEMKVAGATAELAALEAHKAKVSQEIQRTTDRLLADQRAALASQSNELGEQVERRKLESSSLDGEYNRACERLALISDDVETAAAKLSSLNEQFITTQRTQVEAEAALQQLATDKVLILAEINDLKGSIHDLGAQKAELELQISQVSSEFAELRAEAARLATQYAIKKAAKDQELEELTGRLESLQQDVRQTIGEQETIRRELASRQLAADEREKNLSLRERKVQLDENQIQSNAGLLNL